MPVKNAASSPPFERLAPQPIGYLEIGGDSGAAEANGITFPDYGFVHKFDSFLQPALVANIALSGAVLSWHNAGNGGGNDGGWAQWFTEFDRTEQSQANGAVTMAQTTLSGVMASTGLTSVPVTARDNFFPGEYIVLGAGANTEQVQILNSYVAATGAGNLTTTPTTKTHASADPVYHSPNNEGYLPKSQLTMLEYGSNDVLALGPMTPAGTFGTTPGATRGYVPLKHALRSVIAGARCSVIYRDNHVSNIYGGSGGSHWTLTTASNTASYPSCFFFGGGNTGTLHSTTTVNDTVQFSTEPNFAGGEVVAFFLSSSTGGGANWTSTVNGSAGATLDTRAQNAVQMNDAVGIPTGKNTICCVRFTGLAAGVNTFVFTASAVTNTAIYLGWGVIPPYPQSVVVMCRKRSGTPTAGNPTYGLGSIVGSSQFGYQPRSPVTGQTASVTAGAGTASGAVTLTSAITAGAAVDTTTGQTKVYPGDTITIGADGSATQETRKVVAVDTTTTLHVDANFVNTHSTEICFIGAQNADIIGGGYINQNDTQGATSVPGLNAYIKQVVAEFTDNSVEVFDEDLILFGRAAPDPTLLEPVGSHINEKGCAKVAPALATFVWGIQRSAKILSQATVPNKRKWLPIYPSASPRSVVFQNSWVDYFPTNNAYPRSGYYKDYRTRQVEVVVAATAGTDATLFTLPAGYRPGKLALLTGFGAAGPCCLIIFPDGQVQFAYGYGFLACVRGVFLAEQ